MLSFPPITRRIARWSVIVALCGCAVLPARADNATPAQPTTTTLNEERERILEYVQRDDLTEEQVREWIGFANAIKKHAKHDLTIWERIQRALANPWVFFGFAAQGVFMMRFVVQIIASERKKRSYVPIAFWYLSLAGGLMLLTYAVARRDPVFVLGQGLGIFIYARNLMLIRRRNSELLEKLDERGQRKDAQSPAGVDATS